MALCDDPKEGQMVFWTPLLKSRLRRVGMLHWRHGLLLFALFLASCQSLAPRGPAAIAVQKDEPPPIFICSFNVQWLGNSVDRKNQALAQILAEQGCDVVAIQELVAPPDLRELPSSPHYKSFHPATFPDGTSHRPKDNVTDFFLAMYQAGYDDFILSEEDTGRSARNKVNSSATEWWVAFYRTSKVLPAEDLPQGFLSTKVSAHPHWDRVPYAFAFRAVEGAFDFVLISVHLRPGTGPANRARRAEELGHIKQWINTQMESVSEQDYVILGDMNLYNGEELRSAQPEGFISLNSEARHPTNTNLNSPQPYDHAMVNPLTTPEIPVENNFVVLNLLELAAPFWSQPLPYPGDPENYQHNLFRRYFSDHHPVGFFVYPTHIDAD